MGDFDFLPPSLAARCIQYLPTVPSMSAWAEMCLDATAREGAGPMLEAARMRLPLGHHPDVRQVMRRAGEARLEYLKLAARL